MMAANEGKKATEEDAMFTRKPIGPVSCASCDKGIVNLLGTQADYLAWKKLPFREPNERIAKVVPFYYNNDIFLLVWTRVL